MDITFTFTATQMEKVAKHFGKDIKDLEDFEVCELLDNIIDNLD